MKSARIFCGAFSCKSLWADFISSEDEPVHVGGLPAGVYALKIVDENGQVLSVQKFLKK